jgi:3-oxoacyl-[acyl-carrier-protein] synthase III
MHEVYINRVAKCLPNEPVSNQEMEGILGMISGHPSRSRPLVLRQNGIKTRYYVINKQGEVTHSNVQLAAEAVKNLTDESFTLRDIELLCCGTTTPDQFAPSHASMVHGALQNRPLEVHSTTGICCSGVQAYKYGYLSVKSGDTRNAVCTGSETCSVAMTPHNYRKEMELLAELEERPVLAFGKDFLRWMLSDGSGAMLLEDEPRGETPLRVEWIELVSFANELQVCMYAGLQKNADGTVQGFRNFDSETIQKTSMMSLQQDVALLNENVVKYAVNALVMAAKKKSLDIEAIDYFVPHISSEYFRKPLFREMHERGVGIPLEKWFTNFEHVGNVGSASIYLALEELANSRRLKRGDKVLLFIPESGRFMYAYSLLTVC